MNPATNGVNSKSGDHPAESGHLARRRGRITPEPVLKKIEALYRLGYNAAKIRRYLEDRPDVAVVPSLRTIESIVRDIRRREAPEGTDPWRVEHSDPEDAALVLSVVEAYPGFLYGRRGLPLALAEWIVRVRRIAPDLSPGFAFEVAWSYLMRRDEKVDDLDLLLALKPWKGYAHAQRYFEIAKERGWLGEKKGFALNEHGVPSDDATWIPRVRGPLIAFEMAQAVNEAREAEATAE